MARILIVEDEDKLRRTLQRGLEEQGYSIVAADDLMQGLAQATKAFNCIIIDRMLPGGDGLQILADLRRQGKTTPAIILTAKGDVDDRVAGLDSGADDYLAKPFIWAELLASIRVCRMPGEMSYWRALNSQVVRCHFL